MNRCKTCRHWQPPSDGEHRDGNPGQCLHEKVGAVWCLVDGASGSDPHVSFDTGPDFGCVQHEAVNQGGDGMTIEEICREWAKGCSCAQTGKPYECIECTRAFHQAILAALDRQKHHRNHEIDRVESHRWPTA